MEKIGKILPYLLNDFGIDSAVTLKFIRKKWGEIFDFSITEHTFPKNLKDGILQVTVNSHTWLVQLSLLKDEFIKKLSPYGIKDVEFCFGRIYRTQRVKNEKDEPMSLTLHQQEWLKNITENIKDSEIKTTAESILKKYLIYTNQMLKRQNIS